MIKLHKQKRSEMATTKDEPAYWFTLHAKNHQVLMTSETYETKRGAVIGIKSVIKNLIAQAKGAYIDDTGVKPVLIEVK